MKRLLSISKKTIALSILWSIASWSIQIYFCIPFWQSMLLNLFFCALFSLQYPAETDKKIDLKKDWMLIAATALVGVTALKLTCQIIKMPTWSYYLCLALSVIILERILMEIKKYTH